MSKYRDRLQIIADILSITGRGAKKTQIMYQANLSYRLLCRYLDEVLDAGFIKFENGNSYVLTARGEEFLGRYKDYSKRCKTLEDHLNHVNNDRTSLENMCLNVNGGNCNSDSKARNKRFGK